MKPGTIEDNAYKLLVLTRELTMLEIRLKNHPTNTAEEKSAEEIKEELEGIKEAMRLRMAEIIQMLGE